MSTETKTPMKTQHTPGPWNAVDATDTTGNPRWSIRGPNRELVAHVIYDNGFGVRETNARLIANAPQLLRACEIALGQLEGAKSRGGIHAASLRADLEIVREAIAQAKGEQT